MSMNATSPLLATYQDQLNTIIQRAGACDAAFLLDFSEPEFWLGKGWLKGIKNRKSLLYTSPELERFMHRVRSELTKLDHDLMRSVERERYVWSPEATSFHGYAQPYREYEKQITLSFELPGFPHVKAGCNLFFELGFCQDEASILSHINSIEKDLQILAINIASQRLLASPLEDYQLLKPATVGIIRDIANGLSRKQLSETHFMTSRGIDYHVEKAKLTLGAKNTSQLIHLSHQMLII
ncbi:hypothetical protein [Ferrimonas lipolytica]|uniref:Regulatory protein, luxR family n=1 Tax=Ferrimonas lipolytica TaxID=2724191 RepID=A0A6H1UI97_9GAMM|nr:hypothetical protein [Ferrimonas lipolytica]QIZ78330.1 hypothetical protein HER31_16350 [Ferrimonas lipolytica]